MLPGLGVRVYDVHDDGLVFRGGLLECKWVDEDGLLELVVTGVAVRTDEKTGAELGAVPVRGVFRYDLQQGRFRPLVCSPEIYFWER